MDEAGRGAWAGPVVAAAVILPPTVYRDRRLLWGVTDSKHLSAPQRRHWLREIERLAVAIGVSFVAPRTIDARGIAAASTGHDDLLRALPLRRVMALSP